MATRTIILPDIQKLSRAFARFALPALLITAPLKAAVTLPRVLGSHMVLQQDVAAPIWGQASAGESVTVSFRGQRKTTKADADGNWRVDLDPLNPGEAASLTVSASNTVVLEDVLVGEVWVGSGQSNLDTDVPDYIAFDEPLRLAAEREHPQVRLYRSDAGDGWQKTTPQTLRKYSAQLFYFGVMLQRELGVPVGVMQGAVRGTPSGDWIPEDAIAGSAEIQAAIIEHERRHPYASRLRRHEEALARWENEVAGLPEGAKRPEKPKEPPPAGGSRRPRGELYEKHIRPMQPYAIRGVLWDQGEGGTNVNGVPQDAVMSALIARWRRDWGQGDFPFVYQQKPSGGGPAFDPEDPVTRGAVDFAPLPTRPAQEPGRRTRREEYFYFRTVPHTHMSIAADLMPGVHPQNKSGYATRAARTALGAVYHRPVAHQGPVHESFEVEGPTLRINFKNTGGGLTCPAGRPLQGFSIAGADKRFFWADAAIDGDSVILSSPAVPAPVAARYAWTTTYGAEIPWANLFNADGLPAQSFRTDPEM